jgi:arylsulfate sulfotransferase
MSKMFFLIALTILAFSENAWATQADDTTIEITGQTAGPTPFISQLTLTASDTTVIKSIQFSITPKPTSVTRPLSGTYSRSYLVQKGYLVPPSSQIFLPVYGLYHGFTNNVTLTYFFLDGSSATDSTTITTASFESPCGYQNPTVLRPRTSDTTLTYDYIMVKGSCDNFSPAVIDTDGTLRWVGSAGISDVSAIFYNNAFFIASGPSLYMIDLDGTVTLLHDYSDIGVTMLHHTIERGKMGLILEADTASDFESTDIEVDSSGNVLKIWNLADIITAALLAGGDDPGQFVEPPNDWFHNNSVTYNRADDSIAISSRENFVICLDYETSAIKWILGDMTKHWAQFPSLAQYALTLASDTLPPVGQHAVSIAYDQSLLLFDNGLGSLFELPPGVSRGYSSPRKYELNLQTKVATEVWNYEMDQSVFTPLCSSVYEDAPFNYLVDYALVNGFTGDPKYSQLLGLNAAEEKVFYYQYGPVDNCTTAFNASPLHFENSKFPAVGPRVLNLSTRAKIATGEGALIGGFIVTGTESKKLALRVLGPSLADSGLNETLADSVFTLYDSAGGVIATNDDWQSDPGASELIANGLAPASPAEAASVQTLAPGSYTVVATGKDSTSGIGLVEVYDLSPESPSSLANLSTRGMVGTGDDVLIGGFIVGEVANSTVVIRAIGPSLADLGVSDPLANPALTVYNANGAPIAANNDWPNNLNAVDLSKNALAPSDPVEAATILFLAPGSYTTIVTGSAGDTGVALVEIYDLAPVQTGSLTFQQLRK